MVRMTSGSNHFLINTAALARCIHGLPVGKLFQQFPPASDKPLKRLAMECRFLHRAKAAVLMRCSRSCCIMGIWMTLAIAAHAQTNTTDARLATLEAAQNQLDAKLTRKLDELLWLQQLSDIASVEEVQFTGPPPRPRAKQSRDRLPPRSDAQAGEGAPRASNQTNAHSQTTPGEYAPASSPHPWSPDPLAAPSNHVVISALTFLPKNQHRGPKLPLIVLAHGEVHGNIATDESPHVVRELIEQGYAVIAPDYRGSTGYGVEFWRLIDYGGLEIEDVDVARRWMLERHPQIDSKRVGVIGWSHGGAIALLTVFAHPDNYQACYAGVPVSDLEERIRVLGKGYEDLFSAAHHLGKTLAEDPEEYRRRSPAWNADKLLTPLLIQANTNDEDVKFQEVQKLLSALRAEGKSFQCHIYTNAPGGHHFNRLDTPLAVESRREIWDFLRKYLRPSGKLDKKQSP
ncbi:MAG: S9 family peptidase [Verrucomicrobia bacterium]|nr:MAG: S9 family peptidase [Verrucomicrobiota bacterium]